MKQEPHDLGKVISNAFAIAIIIVAFFFAFGAPLLNGLVDMARGGGAS